MTDRIRFSIIIVCLNAGKALAKTVESVCRQDYKDYEIIIKDGGSTDSSTDEVIKGFENEILNNRIKIHVKEDSGIYDAMNQALGYATGSYCFFINAGDMMYSADVLSRVSEFVMENPCDIVYGNLYYGRLKAVIYSAPHIDDFACYRNVPCHQTCFYKSSLFEERGYIPEYSVRADYEHFLWCYYSKKAKIRYIPLIISEYEGGGYSETKENLKLSSKQHRQITVRYMGRKKVFKYRMLMLLTLAPLRSCLANNRFFSKGYNFIKRFVYGRLKH